MRDQKSELDSKKSSVPQVQWYLCSLSYDLFLASRFSKQTFDYGVEETQDFIGSCLACNLSTTCYRSPTLQLIPWVASPIRQSYTVTVVNLQDSE